MQQTDLSNNIRLEKVYLRQGISQIDVSKLTKLKELKISDGNLSELDVSNNPELEVLYCSNNKLKTLDLSNCSKMYELRCEKNELSNIILAKGLRMKDFIAHENSFTQLDMNNAIVYGWWKYDTKVSISNYDGDIRNDLKNKTLCAGANRHRLFVKKADIKISQKNFPDKLFRQAVRKFDRNKDGYLSSKERNSVTEIVHEPEQLFFKKMKDSKKHSLQGIQYFTNLQKLEIHDINIGNPKLSKNRYLRKLYLFGTDTTYVNIKKNTALSHLYIVPKNDAKWIKKHPLKNIDVSKNIVLQEIMLPNGITDIDVSKLEQLRKLYIPNGRLRTLNVYNNKNLEVLDCSGNALTELNLSNNPELTVLLCQNNKLRKLTFFEELWLAWLDCSGNSLAEVDMKNGCVTDTWKRDLGTVFQNIGA